LELDQDVHVTVLAKIIARDRAEERQTPDLVRPAEARDLGVRNLDGRLVPRVALMGCLSHDVPVDHGENCSTAAPHLAINPAAAKS
jgi:hypothetical protein